MSQEFEDVPQDVETFKASEADKSSPLTDTGIAAMRGDTEMTTEKPGDLTIENHPTPDHSFIDKEGRDITLRTWESGDHAYVRAYKTNDSVPENIDRGTVGRANAHLEHKVDGSNRVRLNDIEVDTKFQGSGISEEILSQVERYGRKHDAQEIYGAIDSSQACDFWEHQARNGWQIRESQSVYGDAYKTLN